jgi:hypothetical protein
MRESCTYGSVRGVRGNSHPYRAAPAASWCEKKRVWNKGLEIGQKDACTPAQVRRIGQVLTDRGVPGLRDLALFSVAIDSMLEGPDRLRTRHSGPCSRAAKKGDELTPLHLLTHAGYLISVRWGLGPPRNAISHGTRHTGEVGLWHQVWGAAMSAIVPLLGDQQK